MSVVELVCLMKKLASKKNFIKRNLKKMAVNFARKLLRQKEFVERKFTDESSSSDDLFSSNEDSSHSSDESQD